MERDNYLEGVRGAWLGEQFGEAFFNALAARADNEEMRSTWQTLAQLENVTGARMAALLQDHGESTHVEDAIEIGDEVLNAYTQESHTDAMLKMKDVVEKAVVRFDQLLAITPDDDVEAVQFLVQHELALLNFVECELAGDHAHALDQVKGLL